MSTLFLHKLKDTGVEICFRLGTILNLTVKGNVVLHGSTYRSKRDLDYPLLTRNLIAVNTVMFHSSSSDEEEPICLLDWHKDDLQSLIQRKAICWGGKKTGILSSALSQQMKRKIMNQIDILSFRKRKLAQDMESSASENVTEHLLTLQLEEDDGQCSSLTDASFLATRFAEIVNICPSPSDFKGVVPKQSPQSS